MGFCRQLLTCTFTILSLLISAQTTALLKKAEQSIDRGNLKEAISYYKEALAKDSNDRGANLGLGLVYSELLDNYATALPYLEKANRATVKDSAYDLIFALAKCYQYRADYDKAIGYYTRLQGVQDLENETNFEKETTKRKEDCEYAKSMATAPKDANIYLVNAGKTINTDMPEYVPVLSGHNELLFTSKRKDNGKEELNYMDGKYFESMYIATIQPNSFSNIRRYTLPDKLIDSKLYKHHQAVVSMSQDGKKLFTFKDSKLYEINLDERSTEDPKEVKIKKFDHYQNHAFLTKDGKTLYFTSDVEGGLGGTDIYIASKGEDGQWATPVNIGAPINTSFDEDAPYIGPDGALYFASEGHKGFGNYDIYKSSFINNAWTQPQNLGEPINSPGHDIFLVLDSAAATGYFSSGRNGGFGDMDIYKITYLDKFKKDCAPYGNGIWLSIEDRDTSDYKNSVKINTGAGYKLLSVNWKIDSDMQNAEGAMLDHDYIKKGNYMVYAKAMAWCDTCLTPIVACLQIENKIEKIPPALPVAVIAGAEATNKSEGLNSDQRDNDTKRTQDKSDRDHAGKSETTTKTKQTRLNEKNAVELSDNELAALGLHKDPQLFEFNKTELSAGVRSYLDEQLLILKQHPELGVRVHGYADARGGTEINKSISLQRAKTVETYLRQHGLSSSQILQVKGQGATNFLNHCTSGVECSDEEHQVNRRVELMIVHNID